VMGLMTPAAMPRTTHKLRQAAAVALLLLLCESCHCAETAPPLRATRSKLTRKGVGKGASQPSRFWVRRPDGGTTVELVRSISQVCGSNELDEEEMLKVMRGEQKEHKGWQCGTAVEYASDNATKVVGVGAMGVASRRKANKANEEEEVEVVQVGKEQEDEEEAEVEAEAVKPPKPEMNKMLVQLGVSVLASRAIKLLDKDAPSFVPKVRMIYYAIVAMRLLLHEIISWRIHVTADATKVERKRASDPFSMLLGGLTKPNEPAQSAQEYDAAQLKSLKSSYQMGAIFTFVLHLVFKWNQTLLFSAASSLVELYFHPLFQIHVLRRAAEGSCKRPFGSDAPDMGAMLGAALGQPGGATAAAS